MDQAATASKRSRGIQSVEVGGQLLHALAHHGRPLPLKELARLAGMTPGKAHPYAVSFVHIGLMAQDAQGHYGLGPLALQLGLISLQQYDPVRLATPVIEELAQSTGQTVAMAVWGNRGATIVRVAEPASLVHVALRHGTVMNLVGTATGAMFAAHLPTDAIAASLPNNDERLALDDSAFVARLAEIRRRGLSRALSSTVAGTTALAAPVFSADDRLALVITMIGLSASFDGDWQGPQALKLHAAAIALTRQLGGRLAAVD